MAGTSPSIKALRALLRDHSISIKEFARHVRELTGTNDRLIAVVCGSAVEASLRGLLETFMPNGSGTLFEVNGALSSFSAKIRLAYSLNLIDADLRRNADYIREIRNVFAHRVAPTSFRTKEVATVCRLLTVGKWETPEHADTISMRSRYLMAATETGTAIAKRRFSPIGAPPASLPERRPLLLLRPRRERRRS